MRKPNGRFTYEEMTRFVEIFEVKIAFKRRNGIKTYQISLRKNPEIFVAEFTGDTIKGFRLRLFA